VGPAAAMTIGIVSAWVGYAGIKLRERLQFDDALDVFAVHGLGSGAGVLMTGLFADNYINSDITGGWVNQNYRQLGIQIAGLLTGFAWSFVVTTILIYIVDYCPGLGLRETKENEVNGLDSSVHGEGLYAYDFNAIFVNPIKTFDHDDKKQQQAPNPHQNQNNDNNNHQSAAAPASTEMTAVSTTNGS